VKIGSRMIWLTCLVGAFFLDSGAAFAQGGGKITGIVKDPSAAVIPGATVSLTNTATGAKRAATTDSQGAYSFPALAVGQYDLEASAAGFLPQKRTGLVIDVNSALQVDLQLQLATQSQSVTVSAEGEQVQVEKADTQLGLAIKSQQITEVPLNGRSYTDLLANQAGVVPVTTSATSSTSSGGGFGAVAVSGGLNPGLFSINGQRESANGFMLNGASVEESIAEGAAVIPRMAVIPDFRGETLIAFLRLNVAPGSVVYTDALNSFSGLEEAGFRHVSCSQPTRAELHRGAKSAVPLADRAIGNLKQWLLRTHHGVGRHQLQAYLDEFVFRHNRRKQPMAAFQTLLGLGTGHKSTTYKQIRSGRRSPIR